MAVQTSILTKEWHITLMEKITTKKGNDAGVEKRSEGKKEKGENGGRVKNGEKEERGKDGRRKVLEAGGELQMLILAAEKKIKIVIRKSVMANGQSIGPQTPER